MPSTLGLSSVTVPPGTLRPLAGIATDCAPIAGFDPDEPMPLADYFRLCEALALRMGDEAIHLSLRPLMLGTSDLIRDRLRGAATVREMLEIIAQSLMAPFIQLVLLCWEDWTLGKSRCAWWSS